MSLIRTANRSDAARLAQLAESAFRDAFSAVNTAADMDLHCRTSYSEAIQAGEIANPQMATLLSEDEGRLVGYAQLRWGKTPACVVARSAGEIQRIYVAGDRHGKGIAQELMSAAIEVLKNRGCDVVWLGVWERNPRAIAFYKKFGFVEVGGQIFALGRDPQQDIIMARSVVSAAGSACLAPMPAGVP